MDIRKFVNVTHDPVKSVKRHQFKIGSFKNNEKNITYDDMN